MATADIRLRLVHAVSEVDAAAWDACANPRRDEPPCPPQPLAPELPTVNGDATCIGKFFASTDRYNPFISHDFLSSLERSGSAKGRTGWGPVHLLAEDASGQLLGAVPCYAKTHSQGEYVFDHGWADAFERAGGSYYPKLQVCV